MEPLITAEKAAELAKEGAEAAKKVKDVGRAINISRKAKDVVESEGQDQIAATINLASSSKNVSKEEVATSGKKSGVEIGDRTEEFSLSGKSVDSHMDLSHADEVIFADPFPSDASEIKSPLGREVFADPFPSDAPEVKSPLGGEVFADPFLSDAPEVKSPLGGEVFVDPFPDDEPEINRPVGDFVAPTSETTLEVKKPEGDFVNPKLEPSLDLDKPKGDFVNTSISSLENRSNEVLPEQEQPLLKGTEGINLEKAVSDNAYTEPTLKRSTTSLDNVTEFNKDVNSIEEGINNPPEANLSPTATEKLSTEMREIPQLREEVKDINPEVEASKSLNPENVEQKPEVNEVKRLSFDEQTIDNDKLEEWRNQPENQGKLDLGKEHSSTVLSNNLCEVMETDQPENSAAHHIVGNNTPVAAAKLDEFGIDRNDPANGIFLPTSHDSECKGSLHTGNHLNSYYEEVDRRFQNVSSREEALEVLQSLKEDLYNGDLPLQNDTPNK